MGTEAEARESTYQRTRRSYQKTLCIKTERRDSYWQTHNKIHKLEKKKVCLPRNAKMTLFQQGSGATVTERAQSHTASRHDSLGDCACGLAHELQVCAPTFFIIIPCCTMTCNLALHGNGPAQGNWVDSCLCSKIPNRSLEREKKLRIEADVICVMTSGNYL